MLRLPTEILDKIILFSNDSDLIEIIPNVSKEYLYKLIKPETILIYGGVQSGKTKEIMSQLKSSKGKQVLLIQNSKQVLNQYIKNLKENGLKFHVIETTDGNTQLYNTNDIFVVINNKYRKNAFLRVLSNRIVHKMFFDEGDITYETNPNLRGVKNIIITATPFNMNTTFDRIIKVPYTDNYKGVEKLVIKSSNEVLNEFENVQEGLLLYKVSSYILYMVDDARMLSNRYRNTPVILFCSDKVEYLNGISRTIPYNKSISSIIDDLPRKAIIVSHRMAMRGLSFVSSDYTRHITHQISSVSNCSNFLQSLRILGKFDDNHELKLGIHVSEEDELSTVLKRVDKYTNKVIEF